MEILIFYIWVCNKKDIVFSVRIFFRICNIEIAHYTKKKDTKGKTKSMVFRKTICINAKLDTFHEINETVI